jgi:hypothetical protein
MTAAEPGPGQAGPANDRSRLLVHETITCRSLQVRSRYQQIAMGMKGFDLLGTWQIVGMTGAWPTVLNIWEVPGGWNGWSAFLSRTYGPLHEEMHAYFDQFDEVRSGGSDVLLQPMPWSPSTAQLTAAGVSGSLFVHEKTTVRPGAGGDYLAAKQEYWTPVAADHGHSLVGMFEVLLSDTKVVTIWATDVAGHLQLMQSADPRIRDWRVRSREFTTEWREELMSPAPGTLLAARVPAV